MIGRFQRLIRSPETTRIAVIIYDSLLGALCMWGALVWRYSITEKSPPPNLIGNATLIFLLCCIVIWVITRTSKGIWRFTSLSDVSSLMQSVALVSIITPVILFMFFDRAVGFPRSVPYIVAVAFFGALLLSRLTVMLIRNGDIRSMFRRKDPSLPNAILVGSDKSLHEYLREQVKSERALAYNIIGLIDVAPGSRGRSIRGVPILGHLASLEKIYGDVSARTETKPTIIATDAGGDNNSASKLVKQASEMGAALVRANTGKAESLTPFEAADLIGRHVKALDIEPVRRLIEGANVLVTGGGGSIGSEIAKQVAGLNPNKLTLVDNSEFNLYEINRVLERDYLPETDFTWNTYLADVTDHRRMNEIFENETPEIVLHAAAVKHVRIGEQNPVEALRTNVNGTYNLLTLSEKHDVKCFTLISTDKAVSPTNYMGVSKRLAELLVLTEGAASATMSACAVRFGNVLASNGSVIPLFEEQIMRGGPVTVTHRDVSRYFMTTEEAAALVLQAAALNATQRTDLAGIYLLEMGEPVNIARLARQLIRLRGFVPDRDIKIEYTHLRDGEKIDEFLHSGTETLETTYVDGVLRISDTSVDRTKLATKIDKILEAIERRERNSIDHLLAELVPEFVPTEKLDAETNPVKTADIIPINESQSRN